MQLILYASVTSYSSELSQQLLSPPAQMQQFIVMPLFLHDAHLLCFNDY